MIRWKDLKNEEQLRNGAGQEFTHRYRHMEATRYPGWLLDYQYYIGRQWVKVARGHDGTNRVFAIQQNQNERAILTINKCRPMITRVGNTLYQREPSVFHTPVSTRLNDVAAAQSCDKFNRFIWRENDIPANWRKIALYTPLFGTSFGISRWDPDWGQKYAYELNKEFRQALEKAKTIVTGEEVWNVYKRLYELANMVPNPNAEQWVQFEFGRPSEQIKMPQVIFLNFGALPDKNTWTDFFVAEMVPLSWFEEHYPEKKVTPTSLAGNYALLGPMAGLGARDQNAEGAEQDWALFLEWHIGANKQFPEGKVLRFGGQEHLLLEERDSDFAFISDVLHAIYWTPDPFSAYGISLMSELRQHQIELNVAVSEEANWSEYMKGKWFAPRGIGIPDRLTTDPFEILDFGVADLVMHGAAVKPLEAIFPPHPPEFLEHRIQRAERNMEDAAFYHGSSLMTDTPGVRAGVDFALRLEEDARGRWSVQEEKIGFELSTTKSRLKLVQKYWPQSIKLKIVGEDNQIEVFDFDASQIEGIDVQASHKGETVLSQAIQEDRIRQNYQLGFYGPIDPTHPAYELSVAKAVQALGLKEDSFPFRIAMQSVSLAREETQTILQTGQSPTVYSWHAHGVHKLVHGLEADDPKYKDAPPEARQALEQHIAEHNKYDVTSILGQNQQLATNLDAAMKELDRLGQELQLKTIEADIRDGRREEPAMAEVAGSTEI